MERKIFGHFDSALRDLSGLVPKEDRKQASEYVQTLQQCKAVFYEMSNANRKIEAAIFTLNQRASSLLRDIESA